VEGVGEGSVAPDLVGLGEGHRVVGVVAVGGSARGDDDPGYSMFHAGLEDVPGSDDVDLVFLLGGRVAAGIDDRGEVDDRPDPMPPDQVSDRYPIGDVCRLVDHTRDPLVRIRGPEVGTHNQPVGSVALG